MSKLLIVTLTIAVASFAWGCSSDSGANEKAASEQTESDFQVSSTNFWDTRPRKSITQEHTCYGGDISPPLTWSGAPAGTESFALLADEPAKESGSWSHWVLFNIPAETQELQAGIPTSTATLPDGTVQGTNDFKNIGYNGPCPAPIVIALDFTGNSTLKQPRPLARKYEFKLFALSTMLDLQSGARRDDLISAMEGHILAEVSTAGKFHASHSLDTKPTPEAGKTKVYSGKTVNLAPSKKGTSSGELITPTPNSSE